jgi:hypothetical protein
MNSENPLEPDTGEVLDENQVREIIERISAEIEDLKDSFPHLVSFDKDEALRSSSLIWYRNGITFRSNPDYENEREQKSPKLKKHLVPEVLPVYSMEDGIDLRIELIPKKNLNESSGLRIPDFWIGDHAVEVSIMGAKTKEIEDLREEVMRILQECPKVHFLVDRNLVY